MRSTVLATPRLSVTLLSTLHFALRIARHAQAEACALLTFYSSLFTFHFALCTLPALPAASEQHHEDRGRREIGGGARIAEIARITEPAIHLVDRLSTGRRSDASYGERPPGTVRHVRRNGHTCAAGHVRVWARGEHSEKCLDDRLVPREAIPTPLLERWRPGLERNLERGSVLACDAVAMRRKLHRCEERYIRIAGHVLRIDLPQATRRRQPD